MSGRWACLFCFFFQAEDGIRDVAVTGVQTCALPIYPRAGCCGGHAAARRDAGGDEADRLLERKSGVEGKRVDLGGRRILKKKKNKTNIENEAVDDPRYSPASELHEATRHKRRSCHFG